MEKEILHRVQVNPTPSSIVEANAELYSPHNLSAYPVSMKVAEELAKNANEVSHIPGVTQLFKDLATVLLSRRSADPEQLLEDYLTSKYLPALQTLPHHRCGSVSATERASEVSSLPDEELEPTMTSEDIRRSILNADAANVEGSSLEERLSASGATAMHRAILQRVARLVLMSRPDDVEGFLLTRWEKQALRADDTISVEACPAPPPEDTAHRLENLVPNGCVNGRLVVRHAVDMLLAAKPENPINFLADYYSSRLRLPDDGFFSRLGTTVTETNAQSNSFVTGISASRWTSQDINPQHVARSAPTMLHSRRSSGRVSPRNRGTSTCSSVGPSSTAMEFMRRSDQRWLVGSGSPAAMNSSFKRKEDLPFAPGLGHRNSGFSSPSHQSISQGTGFICTPTSGAGGPSGIPAIRSYNEDPLLEMKNTRPRSPPPPPTLTEVAEGSSRAHYQQSTDSGTKHHPAGSAMRDAAGGGAVKCARFSMPPGALSGGNRDEWLIGLRGGRPDTTRPQDQGVEGGGEHVTDEDEEVEDGIDLDGSGKPASCFSASHRSATTVAAATLHRDLSVFKAKREFRLEVLREEVDGLRMEKSYREMVVKRHPTEEAFLALENVSDALQEAESFLEEFEAHYIASLRSLSRWLRCM